MHATYERGRALAAFAALLIAAPVGTACRDQQPLAPRVVSAPSLAVSAVSGGEDADLIRSIVRRLASDGTLTKGQANSLTSKLDAAVRRLDAGGDKAGDNIVGAFMNEVRALTTARVLTAREAQPLLDAALSLTGNGVARRPMAAGYRSSCALTDLGAAECWGTNPLGQLGDGTTIRRLAPVSVLGGLTFRQVTAGSDHSCGLTGDGATYCWGGNSWGQLGDGTRSNRLTPVAVATTLRFVSITAGAYHTCGLTREGRAYCWGENDVGMLGDGTRATRTTPTPVTGAFAFTDLRAGGFHTCATAGETRAYCWGWNAFGQLGNGTLADRDVPTAVAGGFDFIQIAPAAYHSCGLTPARSAYCWGRIGNDERLPIALPGGLSFASLGEGGTRGTHNCGISTSGPTYCWGPNNYGQLGDGTNIWTSVPTMVVGGLSFTRVTGGGEHNCGRTAAGAIYCWGGNFEGQLGDGTTISRNRPVLVIGTGG